MNTTLDLSKIPPSPAIKNRGWQSRYLEELMTTPGLVLSDEQLASILQIQAGSLYSMKWRIIYRQKYEGQKARGRKRYQARRRREVAKEAKQREAELATAPAPLEVQIDLPLASPPVKQDMVNSPTHYLVGGIETYDFIAAKLTVAELRGYLKGNILKYASRSGHKDSPLQEVGKLAWYAIKLQELEDNNG